jgi:hypothetical protein
LSASRRRGAIRVFHPRNLVGFGPGDIKTAVAFSRDDINDYSTNEPTMDGTAAAILMWAAKN